MLYRIHWLPVLPGSLTIVPSNNPDCPTERSFEPVLDVFPKQFDTQQTQPLLTIAQAFEQGDIRNVGPVRQLSEYNRLPQRVKADNSGRVLFSTLITPAAITFPSCRFL